MEEELSDRKRQQVLRAAEQLFCAAGLVSTATSAIAQAGRISEAALLLHFGSKEQLFREIVERNTRDRVAALRQRLVALPIMPPIEYIESMAESTVLACVGEIANVSVMVWGLMEMPAFAAEIYRGEIGAIEALWESEISARFLDSPARNRLAVHLVPYAVHACMSFGFWLAALRHKPATAQAHARQYAGGIADAARTLLSVSSGSVTARPSRPVAPGV